MADSKELARPFGSCNLTNISVFINGLLSYISFVFSLACLPPVISALRKDLCSFDSAK